MPRAAEKPIPGDWHKPACTVPSQICKRPGLRTGGWERLVFHHLPRPRRQQRSGGRAGSAPPLRHPSTRSKPRPLNRPRAQARPYVLSWLKLANSSWPAPASPLWLARFMAARARRARTPFAGARAAQLGRPAGVCSTQDLRPVRLAPSLAATRRVGTNRRLIPSPLLFMLQSRDGLRACAAPPTLATHAGVRRRPAA